MFAGYNLSNVYHKIMRQEPPSSDPRNFPDADRHAMEVPDDGHANNYTIRFFGKVAMQQEGDGGNPRCREEIEAAIDEDSKFASLDSLSQHDFAIPTMQQTFETPHTCNRILNWGEDLAWPRIIYHIEVNGDTEMLKRVTRRLESPGSAYVVHLASDVPTSVRDELVQHANDASSSQSSSPMCILRGGQIVYLSSSDMQIVMNSMVWLLQNNPHWDFFVSLSGSDYPAMDGEALRGEIARGGGNRTWFAQTEEGFPAEDLSLLPSNLQKRYLSYGVPCSADRTYHVISGRRYWLASLVPSLKLNKQITLSSAGIFHRGMVEFLVKDRRARAAYHYFRRFHDSAVEHYWQTLFTLPELSPMLYERSACEMSWRKGRQTHDDGSHNRFMSMDAWDEVIEPALRGRTPFIRKFDSTKEREVLDRIDSFVRDDDEPRAVRCLCQ